MTLKPILERIDAGEILVADGAMGSLLFQRGLQPGECPESLSLTKPEVLEEVARLYYNASVPEMKNGKLVYPETADFFAQNIPAMRDTGVSIIGGCCGTTPDHIRAIKKKVDSWNK